MSKEKEFQRWSLDKAVHYIYIKEVIFVSLVILCFVGELLAEITDRVALFYWLCVTPVFFCCSLLSEKAKAVSTGIKNEFLIRYELFYWGSAMTAVLLIFLMSHAETIKPAGAAMSIHIILAHTMFLTGIVLGAHYYAVGTILFATAGLSILTAGSFAFDLIVALPIIWLGFRIEKKLILPTLKRKNDFMKEPDREHEIDRRKTD